MKSSDIDTVWVLVSALLVFFMQAGFAARETGLVRTKNAMNAATKIVGGAMVAALLFWIVGFSFLAGGGKVVGSGYLAISGDADPQILSGFVFDLAIALIPAAIAANIASMIPADCVNAKPSAVPRNGAVHGVASTVAKIP